MNEALKVNDAMMFGLLALSFLVLIPVAIKIQRRITDPSFKRLLLIIVSGSLSLVAALFVGILLVTVVQQLLGNDAATVAPWALVAALVVWLVRNLKKSDLFPGRSSKPTREPGEPHPPAPPITPVPARRTTPATPFARKPSVVRHVVVDFIFDYPPGRSNFGEVQFQYQNLKGEHGVRRVRVQEFLHSGFKGYDLGKRGQRQFNYVGIQNAEVTLLDTGEVLKVDEWVAGLV